MQTCCDGDPKIYETGAGADLEIITGQPVMDEGLENASYLSLFTGPDWWGNSISAEAEQYRSQFEEIQRRTLTNQTRLDAEEYARKALAWMVSEGVASAVAVSATIPEVGMMGMTIEIQQPTGTVTIKYQINWATMQIRVRGT